MESGDRTASLAYIVSVLAIGVSGACGGAPSAEETAVLDPQAVRPFSVAVPEDVLSDLHARLERTRLPDQIPGTEWEYGTNRAYLEELLAYWYDDFDWRTQERRLNEWDQFKTEIDGVDLHFVHQRSNNPNGYFR